MDFKGFNGIEMNLKEFHKDFLSISRYLNGQVFEVIKGF